MYNKMDNENKVLRFFFDNPTEKFHIRAIARALKLNPNTILNIISKLEKKGLLIRKKKNHIVEVSADVNDDFKRMKRIDNLKRLYESNIIHFLEKEFNPNSISVIGSYSTGEDIENSDIDIVIISNKNKHKEVNLKKFEKILFRRIHLIVTDYSISEEFYINLINGIVLYGYIDKK